MVLVSLLLLACGGPKVSPVEAGVPSEPPPEAPKPPPPPPAGDGALRLYLSPGSHHATSAELVCPGGYRVRVPLEGGWARFEGVPAGEDCRVYFKGGAPAYYDPVGRGDDLTCVISATTGVCVRTAASEGDPGRP